MAAHSASNDTKKQEDTKCANLTENHNVLCSHTYFDVVAGARMAFNNIASVVA